MTIVLVMLVAACSDSVDPTEAGGGGSDASPYAGSYTIMNDTTGTEVTVTVDGGTRRIVANGLPNHETGEFPNAGNPNSISAQSYDISLPADPKPSAEPTAYNVPQPFGIAYNGVIIDPFAAEWFNDDPASGWQLAALANPLGFDEQNAHVQPSGAYHYHGPAMALLTTTDDPELIGWAADGFPVYGPYGYNDPDDATSPVKELASSYRLRSGERPDGPGGAYDGTYIEDYGYVAGSGDLDECNGRRGVTPEYPDGTYYYVATNSWPYFGRCFVGEIVDDLLVTGTAGGGAPAGAPDFEAAAEELSVTVAELQAALGTGMPPDFAAAAATLGVTEAELREALGAPSS
jgi:hypothetical protein